MQTVLNIGGREVAFKASAATVRAYRTMFARDLLVDMGALMAASRENRLTGAELEIFENFAYICARAATPDNIEPTPDEWLEGFEMLDIYDVLPTLIDLWAHENKTLEDGKKKADQQSGN